MMSGWQDFHFLRPWWLAAFVPLALVLWQSYRRQSGREVLKRFCEPSLLPYISTLDPQVRRRVAGAPLAWAAALALLALAGPTAQRQPQPVFREASALVVALDLSRSMQATDVAPSRLARAVYKVRDLLAERDRGQTALMVFAGKPFPVTPLTDDINTLVSQLETLNPSLMPVQGSDVAGAITGSAALLQQAGYAQGDILLVTDGTSPAQAGSIPKALEGLPYRVSVLAVGTTEGAPVPNGDAGFVKDGDGAIVVAKVDMENLQHIATLGHGRFAALAPDNSDVTAIASFLRSQSSGPVSEAARRASEQWVELGPWLLLPALLLSALAFRPGAAAAVMLVVLAGGAPQTQAAGWWLTPDQAGQRQFQRGDFAGAAQAFRDQHWQAAALYRDRQYAKAAELLGERNDAEAQYNRGNAFARAGQLDQALAAYERALKLDPAHDDARYNKSLLEELMRQQAEQEDKQDAAQQQRKQDGKQQGKGDGAGEGQQGDAEAPAPMMPPEQQAGGEPRQANRDPGAQRKPGEDNEGSNQSADANGASEQTGRAPARKDKAQASNEGSKEEQAAAEQWLRQVPDDPGGLWRRKFQYQYQRQYGGQSGSTEPW